MRERTGIVKGYQSRQSQFVTSGLDASYRHRVHFSAYNIQTLIYYALTGTSQGILSLRKLISIAPAMQHCPTASMMQIILIDPEAPIPQEFCH